MRIGIYKITNPLGQVYIGQSINLDDKLRRIKSQRYSRRKLIESVKLHGWDSHEFSIIHECEPSELDVLEVYYISFFDSFKNGLNSTSGGKIGYEVSMDVMGSENHKIKCAQRAVGNKNHCKKIKVSGIFGSIIYDSINEAAIQTDYSRQSIQYFLNGSRKHKALTFEYVR